MKEFDKGLVELGIELSDYQKQQFVDYYELLIQWNNVMNLTAITELNEIIEKHFIDSLSIVKVLIPTKEKVLDVGTGAGFPGIPLKIVYPELEITLLDSLNKRLKFLEEVICKLKLEHISTLHGRAEDYGKDINYREQFDLCVSRAVAKLSSLSEYCLPYVKVGGYFISYKSGKVQEELDMSINAFQILGAKLKEVGEFKLPNTDIERTLVVLQKNTITPKKYPRSAGKLSKDPL
jgi:16S rRNA (guanine527-N7)-methyltransferase